MSGAGVGGPWPGRDRGGRCRRRLLRRSVACPRGGAEGWGAWGGSFPFPPSGPAAAGGTESRASGTGLARPPGAGLE